MASNLPFVADESQVCDTGKPAKRVACAIDDDATTVVASHDIQCDTHKQKGRGGRNGAAPLLKSDLTQRVNRHNLTPFVKTTGRTDSVGDVRCVALRAGRYLWQFQNAVVGLPHTAAAA